MWQRSSGYGHIYETLDEMPPARRAHTQARIALYTITILYVRHERLIERLGTGLGAWAALPLRDFAKMPIRIASHDRFIRACVSVPTIRPSVESNQPRDLNARGSTHDHTKKKKTESPYSNCTLMSNCFFFVSFFNDLGIGEIDWMASASMAQSSQKGGKNGDEDIR